MVLLSCECLAQYPWQKQLTIQTTSFYRYAHLTGALYSTENFYADSLASPRGGVMRWHLVSVDSAIETLTELHYEFLLRAADRFLRHVFQIRPLRLFSMSSAGSKVTSPGVYNGTY